MIVALAGRRIDPPDAETPRFPDRHRGRVRSDLRDLFLASGAVALVGSGACGADLLAMDVAGELDRAMVLAGKPGLKRTMILPFDRERFRTSSVVDRPGDWGDLFDRVITEVAHEGGLIELNLEGDSHDTYIAVNHAILDEAMRMAASAGLTEGSDPRAGVLAVVVWDGQSRGDDDVTAAFMDQALSRGLKLTQVSTLGPT